MRRILTSVGLASCLTLLAAPAWGQNTSSWHGWLGFGIPVPVGETDDFLGSKTSWNFGAIYSPPAAAWGLRLDIAYSRFALDNQEIIDLFRGQDGYARTWDLGLALELGTNKQKPARFYAIGGIAAVNRYEAVTEPEVVGGCYWDPWWGYICGSGVADEIIVDQDQWAFGANGGLGFSYQIQRGPALFVEGRYRVAFTDSPECPASDPTVCSGARASGINTTWVPITFGLRW
jgi:hypothetical protein